jgi:hypothetical protein
MHHLSSPETRRCFRAGYGENNSDAAAFMLYQMGQAILLFGTAMATSGMGSTSQRVRNWMENDANGLGQRSAHCVDRSATACRRIDLAAP